MMMKLNRIKEIGNGAFAHVYLEQDEYSKQLYATKIIDTKKLNPQTQKYLENEIMILSGINHQNIIKLYNVVESHNYKILVMEYCNGGSLHKQFYDYLAIYKQPFPEKLVQRLMKKILTGVNFLHQNGIIHRDLKLDNILLKYKNELDKNIYSAEIKIIDFNCSFINYGTSKPKTIVGTPQYMAPSVVQNNFEIHYYNEKIDIWSLGIICYEMLFGKPLFSGMDKNEIMNNILLGNFKIPKTISVQARTFLLSMLQKHGINRLSASQLLNHPFIIGDYHYFTKYKNELNANNNNYLYQNNIILNTVNPQYNQKLRLNYSTTFEKICDGCGENLINEYIYKCNKCYGFKYCQRCYLLYHKNHGHQFTIINDGTKNSFFDNINPAKNFNKIIWNIVFKFKENLYIIVIDADHNIKKLLKEFFIKINRYNLINNWQKKYFFLYNAKDLSKFQESKVKDILINCAEINVLEKLI